MNLQPRSDGAGLDKIGREGSGTEQEEHNSWNVFGKQLVPVIDTEDDLTQGQRVFLRPRPFRLPEQAADPLYLVPLSVPPPLFQLVPLPSPLRLLAVRLPYGFGRNHRLTKRRLLVYSH